MLRLSLLRWRVLNITNHWVNLWILIYLFLCIFLFIFQSEGWRVSLGFRLVRLGHELGRTHLDALLFDCGEVGLRRLKIHAVISNDYLSWFRYRWKFDGTRWTLWDRSV